MRKDIRVLLLPLVVVLALLPGMATAAPLKSTTTTSTFNTFSLNLNATVTVTGTVSSGVAGTSVWLQRHDGLRWLPVKEARTASGGKYSVSSPAKVSGRIAYRISTAKNGNYAPNVTIREVVMVKQPTTATVSYSEPRFEQNFTASGQISPGKAGTQVWLHRRPNSSAAWLPVAKSSTDSAGNFSITALMRVTGQSDFRVSAAQNDLHNPSVSQPVTLTIGLRTTTTTIRVADNNLLLGEPLSATGTVSTARAGATVTLQRQTPNGTWVPLATTTTAEDGSYQLSSPVRVTGTYFVRASTAAQGYDGPSFSRNVTVSSWNSDPIQSCPVSYYESGHTTANGEPFDPWGMTAAHKTLPFHTMVRVTNPKNGLSVTVRINDRGPFIGDRCIDLSRGAMEAVGAVRDGVVTMDYQILSQP